MSRTLTPPSDPYENQTYRVLMQRGMPQAQAIERAAFWGALKRSDPTGETVIGPADNPVAKLDQPRFEVDAKTGQTVFKGTMPGAQIGDLTPPSRPTAAAYNIGSSGAVPTIMEYNRSQWIGLRVPVDRFSLNPGADYYANIPGTPPEMFGSGALPLITASGVDPSILRWVSWQLRTSAAYAESRAQVLGFIELSLQGDPDGFEGHVTTLGGAALQQYWGRVASWVATPIDDQAPLTEDDYAQFYPDEQTGK
jgi:hypothetical protein